MVDAQWLRACTVRGFSCTADERDAGWCARTTPENLTVWQWGGEGPRVRSLLGGALKTACTDGSLACVREVKTTHYQPPDRTPTRLTSAKDWPACYVIDGQPRAYTPDLRTIETVTLRIAPADFAQWLHAQGQTPAEHVANWFDSQGVAWPPGAAAEPTMPPDATVADLLQWYEVCRVCGTFSNAEKNAGWLDAMTPRQLASLQHPRVAGDTHWRQAQRDLAAVLVAVVKSGGLVAEQHTESRSVLDEAGTEAARQWARDRNAEPAEQYKTVQELVYRVRPSHFATWLQQTHQQPSGYAQAWFKAKGIAWPPGAAAEPEAAPTPISNVLNLASAPALAAVAPAVSIPSPWRKNRKTQAPEWTGERLAQVHLTLKGRNTTQQLAKLSGLGNREITRREMQAREDAVRALQVG